VVVPNYNYSQYIEERLNSIINQTIPIYELIILDDNSTDLSVNVIYQWLALNKTEAKVIVNIKNSQSPFYQWIKGSFIAKGDYLWIAEADDLCEKNFLETVIPPLVSGKVVLSYSESKQINGDGKLISKNYQDYLSFISSDKWQYDYIESGEKECTEFLSIFNTIPNVSAVLFKREIIQKVFNDSHSEILEYKKAGDWFVYTKILGFGDVAFSAKALNLHRRHGVSVIADGNKKLLKKEIIEMQKYIANKYGTSSYVKQKAKEYLVMLDSSL
jgi:glycosyltransferase involved in cell wall biosynthesis